MNTSLKRAPLVMTLMALLLTTTNTQAATPKSPSDLLYPLQSYLKTIGANDAWNTRQDTSNLTIAVVDTGIDTNHPDLQANLVPGYNVLNPNESPDDDNGHGTNVAGIIGAVGNNKIGVAGIAWHAKIMPIKALDASGVGDELHVAEGIRYAVDHKAKIIVLSLGVFNYSTLLKEAVQYAEKNNVLIVAAAGNEGAEVKYPAAFPTVVGVGGVDANLKANVKSNRGNELSLVAPWTVYTTAKGGTYIQNQGTSMAAPQVAAVAALIWANQPKLQAYEIRQILYQSAQDVGPKGWDATTGYGLLRADRAIAMKQVKDNEPNNKANQATILPLDRMIAANLSDQNDSDWYKINPMYSGTVLFDIQTKGIKSNIKIDVYDDKLKRIAEQTGKASAMKVVVNKGTKYVKISYTKSFKQALDYQLTANFQIAGDAYEDNDKITSAAMLPAVTSTIKGTFSKVNDLDWYAVQFENDADLDLTVGTDTHRMDLELLVQKDMEFPTIIDGAYEGGTEVSPTFQAKAGETYYFRIRNINDSDNVNPVNGEYTVNMKVTEHFSDENEPNNYYNLATPIVAKKPIEGTFTYVWDQDWYKFNVTQQSYLNVRLDHLPSGVSYNAILMNAQRTVIQVKPMHIANTIISFDSALAPGAYYLKLTTSRAYDSKRYGLTISFDPLVSGYRDINDHWAKNAIVKLVKAGVLVPDQTQRFRPDAYVTRAEAANLVKTISKATKQGIVGSTAKNAGEPITRAQAAEIACKLLGLDGQFGLLKPFDDVSYTYWATKYIRQAASKKLMGEVKDGKFYPEKAMTRAEFALLLVNVLNAQE